MFRTGLFILFCTKPVWWKIVVFQLVAGVAAGPVSLCPMLTLQNHLQPADIFPGTAAFTFLRSLSSSISVVCGGVVLQNTLHIHSFTLSISNNTTNRNPSDGRQHYLSALSQIWMFCIAISGTMLISGLFTKQKSLATSTSGSFITRESYEMYARYTNDIGTQCKYGIVLDE